jgi:PKD repeat protein
MRCPLRPAPAPDRPLRGRLLGVSLVLLLSGFSAAIEASTPVVPVPASRWGTLEPRAILLDTSWYMFNFEPSCAPVGSVGKPPYWAQSIDVQNGRLFAATGNHVIGWDIANPGAPREVFNQCRPTRVPCCSGDTDWFFNQVRAPEGDSSVIAIAGDAGLGVVVLATSSPQTPSYQDADVNVAKLTLVRRATAPRDVAVVNLAGSIKFALYDLQKAKVAQCHERNFAGGSGTCSAAASPYLGVSTVPRADHFAGAGRYLVASHSNTLGVWDFGPSVTSPTHVGTGSPGFVRALEAWEQGGQVFVAVASSYEVKLYSYPAGFTTCAAAPCQPNLVKTLATPGGSGQGTSVDSLRVSKDGGRVYLYVGSGGVRGTAPQREWIFDVTNPALAEDLTPQHPEGYWGWYYLDNGGFDNIDPGDAVVGSSHLYRATHGLLDVHAIALDAPPVADFTWSPSGTIYLGSNVQFQDLSTREPDLWHWTFGTVAVDSGQNPTLVLNPATFAPGPLPVTLRACNAQGCDQVTKTLQLVDPMPALGSVTVSSTTAKPCETIRYSAVSPSGQPPLIYDWRVRDAATNTVVVTQLNGGATYDFALPPAPLNGYRGELTLRNSVGQDIETSPVTNSQPLDALAISGLTYDTPIVNGAVQFHLQETGATKWEWFWDVSPTASINAPDGPKSTFTIASEGRNPLHHFPPSAADETYRVVVRVSNCVDPAPRVHELTVQVPAFLQLEINRFEVFGLFCLAGTCQATPGSQLEFYQEVDGAPELYDYDWNGDGTFEDAGHAMPPFCPGLTTRVCHTYPSSTSGTFRPALRIRRGSSSETLALTSSGGSAQSLQFGNPPPISVTVNGPGSLTPGQSATYTASASGCTPSGWSWSATGGGSVSGTGSSVTASWASAGTWSITATAQGSGCSNTSGSRSVSVTSSTGGGGGGGSSLIARFTRSPSGAVSVGQQVTFDASTSSGTPSTYTWDFGDGTSASTTSPTTTHTYTKAGSHTVILEVAKPGDCSFNLCTHSTGSTIQVNAGGSGGSGGTPEEPSELAAKFTFGPASPHEEDEIHFDASGSTGSPSSYAWDFGDGATGNGKNVTHAYQEAGAYTVKLTVKKFAVSGCGADNVCTHSITKKVTIEPLQRDGDCVPGPNTLCLRNRRFEVGIELTGQPEGTLANIVPGQTGDSGLFWFFDPSNWEVLVKVLDGCAVTGSYWVFAASTTDQGYVLTVTDRSEDHDGTSVQYVNQPGNPAPAVTDTGALAVCEAPPE